MDRAEKFTIVRLLSDKSKVVVRYLSCLIEEFLWTGEPMKSVAKVEKILGRTRIYGHKDMPDALRRIAENIPRKEGNPHLPVYDKDDLAKVIEMFETEFNVYIPQVYVRT